MASSYLKNVKKIVHLLSEDAIRSALVEYLKASSVPLESRKQLMSRLKKHRVQIDKSYEIYPGHKIPKTSLEIMYNRKLHEGATLVHGLFTRGIVERKDYREAMVEELKEFGYSFDSAELRNTKILSAIDSLTLLCGYYFVKSRTPIGSNTPYSMRMKSLEEFKYYSKDNREDLARSNMEKIDMMFRKLESVI